jgi:hypothetical protein
MGWIKKDLADRLNIPAVSFATHSRFEGKRYHNAPIGTLPGVTTILNETKHPSAKAALDRWRDNNQGESDRCLNRGNEFHSEIENYFNGVWEGETKAISSYKGLGGFLRELKPLAIEYPLYSLKGYAGSPDCLGEDDKGLVLIDWKTSTKKKTPSQVADYFLQLSAYDALIIENLDLMVDRAIVALAIEETKEMRFFELDRAELNVCYQSFLDRLEAYNSMNCVMF